MQTTKSSPLRRAADLAARDRTVMLELQKEQDERDRKTARLRALRLAKEAADKETAEKAEAEQLLAAAKAIKTPRRRRKSPVDEDGSVKQAVPHG